MWYWIEHLEPIDEWDENSENVWVLVLCTYSKKIAEEYLGKPDYRIIVKEDKGE